MKKQIVITGATGLIGSHLVKRLSDSYQLTLLTRNPKKYIDNDNLKYKYWDGKSAIPEIVVGCYGIINLLGENIGKKRWTQSQKDLILNSRQDAAQGILDSINQSTIKPSVWIQASATGYYGQNADSIFNENSPKEKKSFLADVCEIWEQPVKELNNDFIRKVIVRTGIVLAKRSDLWKQLTLSFKFGVAAIPGSGKQHLPWIHIHDEVSAIIEALENDTYEGIFNLASPNNCTMKELVGAIKSQKRSIITLPIPTFFLKALFGEEMTKEVVLSDQKVVPQHLLDKQFQFKYSRINEAVKDLA